MEQLRLYLNETKQKLNKNKNGFAVILFFFYSIIIITKQQTQFVFNFLLTVLTIFHEAIYLFFQHSTSKK